jgi:hypothetical protein
MPEIRVLAVRQPWASLIVEGLKTLEIRSNLTNKRERVAIYCSKNDLTEYEENQFLRLIYDMESKKEITKDERRLAEDNIRRMGTPGRIIGTVEITNCRSVSSYDILCLRNKHFANNITLLHYCWEFSNPIKFSSPIPYKPPKGAVIWSKTVLPEGL